MARNKHLANSSATNRYFMGRHALLGLKTCGLAMSCRGHGAYHFTNAVINPVEQSFIRARVQP
eukprot:3640646-Alexandrium_andersonii.AAC.1